MIEQQYYSKIEIENIGPFKFSELKLRPLTILLGRNASGKSFIMRLLWTLGITLPDFQLLYQRIFKYVQDFYNTKRKELFQEVLKKLIEYFPEAYAKALKRNLSYCLEIDKVVDLLKNRNEDGRIEIETQFAKFKIIVTKEGEIRADWLVNPQNYVLKTLELLELTSDSIAILDKATNTRHGRLFKDVNELTMFFIEETLPLIIGGTLPPISGSPGVIALMIDGRSGLIRSAIPGSIPELEYTKWITIVYKSWISGNIDLTPIKEFLQEIGCKEIKIESIVEYPLIKVITWDGKELDLRKAPSGVRESLIPCLIMCCKTIEPCVVYFEEPEAHLHLKAIEEFIKSLTYVINKMFEFRKFLITISTHNPDLVYILSNMIMLSNLPENERFNIAKEIGYVINNQPLYLKPEWVSVYLIRRDDKEMESRIEEVKVNSKGIDENEFAKIAEEFLNKRSMILEKLPEELRV